MEFVIWRRLFFVFNFALALITGALALDREDFYRKAIDYKSSLCREKFCINVPFVFVQYEFATHFAFYTFCYRTMQA